MEMVKKAKRYITAHAPNSKRSPHSNTLSILRTGNKNAWSLTLPNARIVHPPRSQRQLGYLPLLSTQTLHSIPPRRYTMDIPTGIYDKFCG